MLAEGCEAAAGGGIVIGLTGAPGSGKTAAAAVFGELGAKVIALDKIGHELLGDSGVRGEIREAFSSGVFRIMDGQISRRKLADVVFENPEDLGRLNRILHPRMSARVRAEVEALRKGGSDRTPALVIEGALVFEMGLAELCDHVVLVKAAALTTPLIDGS